MEDIQQKNILEICDKKYHYLMNLSNVVGVGLGYKYIKSIKTSMQCIHVLVEKKVPNSYIGKDNLIPKNYLGVTTDVIETGKLYARGLTNMVRPLQGGYAISINDAVKGLVGTIGCIVTKKYFEEKYYYILTNNHVIVRDNSEVIPEKIIQPALEDGGKYPKNFVAILSDFVELKFKGLIETPVNYMDCAIARLVDKKLKSNIMAKLGKIKGTGDVSLDESIKMVGSTTGLSIGHVLSTGVTSTIEYPSFGGHKALFKNQVSIKLINNGGDSGATVLNSKNEILGLFFSGGEKNVGLMTPIKPVLKALKVELYK